MHTSVCYEKGIFSLGTRESDSAAVRWVMDRNGPSSANRPVILAGNALEVVIAAGSLLSEGVDAERLTLVNAEENLDGIANHNVNERRHLCIDY